MLGSLGALLVASKGYGGHLAAVLGHLQALVAFVWAVWGSLGGL